MPEPLELGKLPEPDALAFVMELCPRIGDAAKQLALLCGYLPLALRISATYLAKPTRSIDRYLSELGDERTRLRKMRGDDPEADVEASFNLSYGALSLPAKALLRQLGVFAASFSRLAVENVAEFPVDVALDNLLDELHTSSLLDYDPTTERWALHDLVRLFALDRLREAGKEEAARLRYAEFYRAIAQLADTLFLQGNENIGKGLVLFDAERGHIDAAWTWLRRQAPGEATDNLLLGYADATAHIGDLRYSKQNERISQLEAALTAAQRRENRGAEGAALNNLGRAYADLGDARTAIEFYEQRMVIAREIGDRRGEGAALNNLGRAYAALGDMTRALACAEQAYSIFVAIESPYRKQAQALAEWLKSRLAGGLAGEQPSNESVVQPLIDFLNAQALTEMRDIVDANPPLLTDAIEPVFDALLQQYKDDEDAVNMLAFKREVLQACRQHGVDAVFADLAQQLTQTHEKSKKPGE